MKLKQWVLVGGIVLVTLGFVCGCHRQSEPEAENPMRLDPLVDAAWKTHAKGHSQAPNNEIPPQFWDPRIQALKPIKVYTHRANVVVVQRVQDGVEEGTYIYIPISSYLPMTGDDGFTFSPEPKNGNTYSLGTGIFEYKRTGMGVRLRTE